MTLPAETLTNESADRRRRPRPAGLIAFTLTQAGYLVVKASDGAVGASTRSSDESPDLVVLDINMPGASGFQVCEAIRAQVARADHDAHRARRRRRSRQGARAGRGRLPDQALQPAHAARAHQGAAAARRHRELGAAVRRAASRSTCEEHTVRIGGGEPVRLTKLELRLLQMLLANAGRTVSSDRLLMQVWGHRNSGRPPAAEAARAPAAAEDRSRTRRAPQLLQTSVDAG